MARPKLSEMTLREKIGQTGLPSQKEVRKGADECGGLTEYFKKYPFTGLYVDDYTLDKDGNRYKSSEDLAKVLSDTSNSIKIPLLVSCDWEQGASGLFSELHRMVSNMSVGAAYSKELAYWRGYWWARELKTVGVNWAFGPMGDPMSNFFSVSGSRCLADNTETIVELFPSMIKGVQDAGVAATAKHFPGGGHDYRDSHYAFTNNDSTREQWDKENKPIWQCAVDAGAYSFMIGHKAALGLGTGYARGNTPRPASASKNVVEGILREELGFDGVIVTDSVSMNGLSSAFDYEDVYIECFNAGNDIVLFMRNDYIDIMEKAVLDGRISMERLDASVERILDMKEKLGLFDGEVKADAPLTEEERNKFDEVNYTVSKKALTLIRNASGTIPFNPEKVKSVGIIRLAPHESFIPDLQAMVDEFEKRGINVEVIRNVRDKDVLRRLCDDHDILIYAAFLMPWKPAGMPFFAAGEDLSTLYHGLSIGAEKSVVASFGHPSIYYNYFENADMYINAYSSDAGTMRAFVDGILGEFEFTGKSPVALKPEFKF